MSLTTARTLSTALSLLVAAALAVASLSAAPDTTAAAATAAQLPAGARYVPVTPVEVLNTRDLPTGALQHLQVVQAAVTGQGSIPASGVTDVYVQLDAAATQASGCLVVYDPDDGVPGSCAAPFQAGGSVTASDIVQVSQEGTIAVQNFSPDPIEADVTVTGYYTDGSAGEEYVPVQQVPVLDTRSGLGAPQAQVPSGGSLTVQIGGVSGDGVPAGAAGAVLDIGAANASEAGSVAAWPAGDPAASAGVLTYEPGQVMHNLYIGPLSSTGQLTLENLGPDPVDLLASVQGFLASTGGSTYQDVPQDIIADTETGAGGIAEAPVPAGGSITISPLATDGLPSADVSAVAESVTVANPTASGYLSLFPAGGTDPTQPGVNFTLGNSQDGNLTAAEVSASGQQTIVNHSTGTIEVIVTLLGYYSAITLCSSSTPGKDAGVDSDAYYIVTDPWGLPSSQAETECITSDGGPDFAVTYSSVSQTTVGAFPDLAVSATTGGMPVQVSDLGDMLTSWTITPQQSGEWDAAYDLTYSDTTSSCTFTGGAELMVWLDSNGGARPAGSEIATGVYVDGATYNVWSEPASATQHSIISFQLASPATSATRLDIGQFTRDATIYGDMSQSLYLCSVQAGFELWQGGLGLSADSFSATAAPLPPAGPVTSGVPGLCLDDHFSGTTAGNPIDVWACNATDAQVWTVAPDGTLQVQPEAGGSTYCLDAPGGDEAVLEDCTAGSTQLWQPGADGRLVNSATGTCLTDPGSAGDGTQLTVTSCTGAPDQSWQLPYDGPPPSGPVTGIDGLCMDDHFSGTSAGNPVDVWTCNGTGAQDWTIADNGTVENVALPGGPYCLDVSGGGTASGSAVVLDPCDGGASQQWYGGPGGSLVNPASRLCLDDPAASTTNGTQLDIAACAGSSEQSWHLPSAQTVISG